MLQGGELINGGVNEIPQDSVIFCRLALGDGENFLLRTVQDGLDFCIFGAGKSELYYARTGINKLAQHCLFRDDFGVVACVRSRGHRGEQRVEIGGAADALEVIKAVELGGQNDGVDVLALGI